MDKGREGEMEVKSGGSLVGAQNSFRGTHGWTWRVESDYEGPQWVGKSWC